MVFVLFFSTEQFGKITDASEYSPLLSSPAKAARYYSISNMCLHTFYKHITVLLILSWRWMRRLGVAQVLHLPYQV